ncbi:MAG: nitrous oxide-stimulated promoter family protein [Dehalococcoidia bacterium]|nr:nitrous oxide-stimulated promoter family protein [Dehalococcoidia bacterium]
MNKVHRRITRESQTVAAMISVYCRAQHGDEQLCPDCSELLAYANQRLRACPFQEGKTTCAKCPVHCFQPLMRDKIRTVMRYSGPRMLCRHPILAVRHFLDRTRKEPVPPRKRADRRPH